MRITTSNWLRTVSLAVSCLALCQGAAALEPVDALTVSGTQALAGIGALASTRLVEDEALDLLRESARKTHAERNETKPKRRPLVIKRTSAPAMFERMIELEALPFVKVSDNNSHRVYFGISFDGVLGIHGNF